MNHKVLTTIALCSATLTLITTAAPAAAAVTGNGNQARVSRATEQETIKPSMDINLSATTPTDLTGNFKDITTQGSPQLVLDSTMNGEVAKFNGKSGYRVNLKDSDYDQFKKGVAIEAFFKYEGSMSGEHDIFSNQEGGGLGLGVENGVLKFFAYDQGYKTPTARLKVGKWMHAVGVMDTQNKQTKLYVNGKLVETVANNGGFGLPKGSAKSFFIGGDSGTDNNLQNGMEGKVKNARIYNQVLTDGQIKQLSDNARKNVLNEKIGAQALKTELVGPSDVVAGHIYNLNVQSNQADYGDIDQLEYDVTFDPTKFEYLGADSFLGKNGQTSVTKKDNHTLHVTTTAELSKADFNQYNQTRLARVQLKAKTVGQQNTSSTIVVKNPKASIGGQAVADADLNMDIVGKQNVTIHAKNINDYNGDGIVGAGDVALAPEARKAEVAKAAEIRPYKHVVVLTTDGGGNPWDPNGMYYDDGTTKFPRWTTNPALLAKRKNSYAMNLFNKQFAMSTTAQAVQPTISAQNYSSMLHGLAWDQMDKEYQMTNSTARQKYFADFGKKEAKYPSIFKVLQKNNPTQGLAAFAEWHEIIDGITEPDAAVEKARSDSWKSFDDVANYIGDDKFNDTSLVYMQSDQMDEQGHGYGWYNDAYWATYSKYDALFKKVMDKLESTGHIHDTLVIANSDHGGSGTGHGNVGTHDKSNYNTYLALGGETIDSGRHLEGGSNADVSPLILKALQVEQPKSMTGKVFDSSAFLDQTELSKKNRNVESINLEKDQNKFALKFKAHDNRQIRTIDARIDLAGQNVDKINVSKNAKVIRQDVQNGILKLTLSFDKQPEDTMAVVSLKADKAKAANGVAIKQAMLGTDKGNEVLSDLNTKAVDKVTDMTDGKPAPAPQPGKPGEKPAPAPQPGKPGEKPAPAPQPSKPGEKPAPAPAPGKPTPQPGKPVPAPAPGKPTPQPGKPVPAPAPGKPTPQPGKPAPTPEPGKPAPAPAPTPEPGKPVPAPEPGNSTSQSGSGSGSTTSEIGSNSTTSGSNSSSTTDQAGSTTNVGADQLDHKKPAKKNKLKGKIVYAQKKLGFYKKAKFTKKNRYKFFTAKTQSKWAQFKIVTKKGNRYQVKDINKGSKTYGKVGYITTSSKYVTSADYTKKPIKIKALKTLSAYKSKTLKGKHTTYKRGTMLKVKKLVKSKGKYRLQLKNGKYITVDKHMIHAYFAHK